MYLEVLIPISYKLNSDCFSPSGFEQMKPSVGETQTQRMSPRNPPFRLP